MTVKGLEVRDGFRSENFESCCLIFLALEICGRILLLGSFTELICHSVC